MARGRPRAGYLGPEGTFSEEALLASASPGAVEPHGTPVGGRRVTYGFAPGADYRCRCEAGSAPRVERHREPLAELEIPHLVGGGAATLALHLDADHGVPPVDGHAGGAEPFQEPVGAVGAGEEELGQ